jgi:hypothetical protein
MAQNPFGALSNNDFISQLLGTAPDYSEAIGADQQKRLIDNAQQQAMLNGVIALLGLSGPQRQQVGTGQALGAALGAGIGGYNESMDRTLKQALTGMQLQEYTAKRARQAEMQRGLEGAIINTPQPIPMATGPGSQFERLTRPEFGGGMADAETIAALTGNLPTKQTIDPDKLLAVIAKGDPLEAAKLMVKEGKESFQPMTNDQKKQYGLPVNKPYQISSSGKILDIGTGPQSVTNLSVSTEKGYGGELANQLAKDDATLYQAARKAPQVLANVEATKQLLDNKNLITGAFADEKLNIARIGQALGVTGKSTDEMVANTQTLFASRAGAVLDSIRASNLGAGQGFSNADRDYLEKAKLGGIKFSPEALRKQLAIEESVARASANAWNERLDVIPSSAKTPLGLSKVELQSKQPAAPAGVRRFNPATNKVE